MSIFILIYISFSRTLPTDFVRLDQDILSPLAGKKQLYTYETIDFWEQIKTPGYLNIFSKLYFFFNILPIIWPISICTWHYRMSLRCSALYLAQFRVTSPHLLAGGDGNKSATIVDDVFVHPSAKVHPTAKVIPSHVINSRMNNHSPYFLIANL